MALMLMFIVAFIAGQARANLPAEHSVTTDFGLATEMSISLDAGLQKVESLPFVIELILALAVDVVMGNDEISLLIGTRDDAAADSPGK